MVALNQIAALDQMAALDQVAALDLSERDNTVGEETTPTHDPGREDTGSLAKILEEWQVCPLLGAGCPTGNLQPCLPVCGQEGERPLPSAPGLF